MCTWNLELYHVRATNIETISIKIANDPKKDQYDLQLDSLRDEFIDLITKSLYDYSNSIVLFSVTSNPIGLY